MGLFLAIAQSESCATCPIQSIKTAVRARPYPQRANRRRVIYSSACSLLLLLLLLLYPPSRTLYQFGLSLCAARRSSLRCLSTSASGSWPAADGRCICRCPLSPGRAEKK